MIEIFKHRRSYAYRRTVSLFKKFLEGLDDLNKRYLLHALELAVERWDPAPFYHFLSFKERESIFQETEYKVKVVPYKTYPGSKILVLPRPSDEAIADRVFFGKRDYEITATVTGTISLQTLSNLLYFSFFSKEDTYAGQLKRPYVSLTGQPVIEVYLYSLMEGELFRKLSHYLPHTHSLEIIGEDDLSKEFYLATLDSLFEKAKIIFIFTVRYGEIFTNNYYRGYRIALLEAGSALSAFLRATVALNLGARVSLDFIDRHVCRNLSLDCYQEFPFALASVFAKGG